MSIGLIDAAFGSGNLNDGLPTILRASRNIALHEEGIVY